MTDNKNEKKSARRFDLKKLWAGLKPKLAERAGLPVAILAVCLGVAVFISIGFMSGYSFNLMQVEEKLSPELKTKISELAKKASEQMAKREAEQKPPEPPPPAPATPAPVTETGTSTAAVSGTPYKGPDADGPKPPVSVSNPGSNANPDLTTDAQGLSRAVIEVQTDLGKIRFKLYANDAPNTVKRFIELVNSGFYNGLKFHRVVPGFVVQGGDPLGDGTGGSGQKLKAEFNARKHVEGAVAMARTADPDSADSQFYISLGKHPHLDGKYTVFGLVIFGMDVARKIKPGDRMKAVIVQ